MKKIKLEAGQKICVIPQCLNPMLAHGLCSKHYARRRYRDKHNLPTDLKSLATVLSQAREHNNNWRGGISHCFNYHILKRVKKQRLEESKYICELCDGIATVTHHKDRTKTNHSPENLMVLCWSCHKKQHPETWIGKYLERIYSDQNKNRLKNRAGLASAGQEMDQG